MVVIRTYTLILSFGCRPAFYGNPSSLKLASCLHVSGVSPLTFGLHVQRDTACTELMELGFVELLILWFEAQTWLFPQLIAVITDSMQLISVMHIVRSCPETSPCDHFIVAITGNLRFISAVHIIRSCFKKTSLWPAGYKDGLVAVRSLPAISLCL